MVSEVQNHAITADDLHATHLETRMRAAARSREFGHDRARVERLPCVLTTAADRR